MSVKRRNRGIERKILTSIMWVGVVPIVLVMIFGFVAARFGQSYQTDQNLAAITQTTATGVKLAVEAVLSTSSNLAYDSRIIDSLDDAKAEGALDESTRLAVLRRFEKEITGTEDPPEVIRLYDADGDFLLSSDSNDPLAGESLDTREDPMNWYSSTQAQFIDFDYDEESQRLKTEVLAPVFSDVPPNQRLGYTSEIRDITPMLSFAFGRDPDEPRRAAAENTHYQIAYLSPNNMTVSELRIDESTLRPNVLQSSASEMLEEALRNPQNPLSGTLQVPDYQSGAGKLGDAFVAFHRLLEEPGDYKIYVVVYQLASDVYADINRAGAIALVLVAIFIGVLCLNAYRNVHNNIVRPVSLLNEGAQIIGQGDLELKLKIDTGDEIQELAQSFNKMALDLKRNIRQLEESEERYRSLVTSMRDGIFHVDSERNITFMNNAGMAVFGFRSLDEAIDEDLEALFRDPSDLTRIIEELDHEGYVERSRLWMKRNDGREIIVEVSFNLVHDDDGNVTGIEGIFRDVTLSVKLEQEARDRSERIAAINQIANVINSSLEAGRLYESLVVEVKKLVDFDYAALSLLNGQGDSFTHRQLWPAGDDVSEERPGVDDQSSCAAWVARKRECLIIDDLRNPDTPFADQFPSDVESCICVPLYATGRIIGTLNLGAGKPRAFSRHDVEVLEQMAPHVAVAIRNARLLENLQQSLEEVTRAREKLHDVNEELKTLDEMKTNLLSNVSHELRTPLVSVMGYTDMILNEKVGPVNDIQRDYLQISLRNIDKLVTLIENLLDFSRLHRGAETLVFDSFDLVDCARASLQVIQPVAESREIELILDAPEHPVIVEGDKSKLGQVFNNLLSNAVKFNHPGGNVTISIEESSDTINVTVSDTGIGIPPEALDKVFTRFYQYDSSSTRRYGGTGIGLAIAQDIARLHGSHITVTSESGKGSTFRFNLPNPRAREDESGDTTLPLPQETELLVELVTEDRALLGQLRGILEPDGMEVINATNAAHALSLARKHHPDCIIVDVEHSAEGADIVNILLDGEETKDLPLVMITNDDAVWRRFRETPVARIKRDFRKSTLMSGIRYSMRQITGEEGSFGNKVLVVDDDTEILTFIKRCLEPEGYVVHTVESGEEALERLQSRDYGLVLLDIAMPGLDGWETCRQIKSDSTLEGIRVFMVTAKPIDKTEERARRSGADGFLFKPFRPEDLIELVRGLEPLATG